MLRKLLAHVSVYTAGSVLVTLAGFISFPIFTRIFTIGKYVLLNLVSSSLLLVVGVAKLGVQHSIVRFYGEVLGGKRSVAPVEFYSTVLFGLAGSGLVAAVAWAAASQIVPARWWNDPRAHELFLLTAVLVFVRATDSAMVNILRAQERSVAFNAYAVLRRYGTLAVVLPTVFYVIPGLDGFYAGTILVEAVAVLAIFLYLRGQCRFSPSAFSPGLYRAMLAFGIPMIAFELGGIVLNLGDRFVIQNLLGGEALGLYSAAYNLCEYVQAILIASIGQAIVPMYIRIWEREGEAQTRHFVQRALHLYVMLGGAVVAGMAAVGPQLLTLLATEKFRDGAVVIPYVIGGMVLIGATSIVGAGLNIFKQTRVLMILVVACAVLNLGLNALLVPFYGIEGSAMASLASYACLSGLVYFMSNRRLAIPVPWAAIGKFAVLSLVMYLIVSQVALPSNWARLPRGSRRA